MQLTKAQNPVLVIDDSATYGQQFKEIVETEGYPVLQPGSGEEGLRLAAESHPLAIVVDGIMPGVDGLTVVRRLRSDEVLRQIPCLFVTADDDESVELRALEAGADLSHEIRTPLHGVIGMTELLRQTRLGTDQRALVDGATA